VTEQRFREEPPKSRRERRQEQRRREWRGGLAKFLARRRASGASATEERLWEGEVPRSRRDRRRQRELRRQLQRRRKWQGGLRELILTVLIAVVVVFGFVKPFVVEAYRIPSESMVPTLMIGDRILANKFVYRVNEPQRGDVVVFDSVEDDDETLIKRVVGVAGDVIQVRNGSLLVNDEPQEEPYLNDELPSYDSYGPTTVPQGHVFVMGDNRANSGDSRIFGPVPLDNVKGEAFLRFWPIPQIGPLSPEGT
jgi:signal peptidase I